VVARRSGLGRGLGALIPAESPSTQNGDALADGPQLLEIPVSRIAANRFQPREAFDEETLASLTASVRELGVLQPILVRPAEGGDYELIAGERRWRAAKRAGLHFIPAIVRSAGDTSSLEQALVENLHRQDLNVLEEGAAYLQLIEEFGFTHEQVAQRVGKSRTAVTNTLRLFQLPPTIQRMVKDGLISAGHGRALLGTPDRSFQEHLAKRVTTESLSVRDVEEVVRSRAELEEDLRPSAPATAPRTQTAREARPDMGAARPSGLLELEELFSHYLDTRVQVSVGPKKGKIVIEFAGIEDLERIYRVIAETRPD
jgi:ParB family chromosome partitioning protein